MAKGPWVIRGHEAPTPRFRNPDGKEWYIGDTITEEDLLGMYTPDQLASLIASGALEPIPDGAMPPGRRKPLGG